MTAPWFSEKRNVELSTIQYLETELQASWTGITVVKSFTQAYDTGINPPIVSIYMTDTNNTRREVGSTALFSSYQIAIDIFAKSDGQRIDLSAFIVDKLKDGWVYYLYSHPSGSPQTLDRTANGRVYVSSFDTDTPIRFGETVDMKDKFRHSIIITVRK